MEEKCKKCGRQVSDYKCADCGAESKEKDESHMCGNGRSMPKCVGCSEAEENCNCD